MKKLIALTVCAVILCTFSISASAANLTVDLSKLEMNEAGGQGSGLYPSWTAGGYAENTPVITFMNFGAAVNLGKIDLSKYGSVRITYGQHSGDGKGFGENTYIAIATGPVQDEAGEAKIQSIYARITPTVTDKESVSWKDATQTAGAVLDLKEFENGENIYLSVFIDKAKSNGVSIDSVTFVEKEADNPSTGDAFAPLMMLMIALSAAGVKKFKDAI